ncbi:hypothetical protein [Pyrococcus sp. ST04]|uniref:hypothetical protein n=1 Tax=Pyrococcus sp. ST04 TaxID=1183377 RepID=UPI00026058A0|nr:hypothetical protein [Pyrococcus sp. ST04]AFK22213.1 hypothetical protein Py04_0611 [Pyrococcus sp. ST04]
MIEELLRVRKALEDGDIEKALKIANGIQDNYWRSYALKWIAQELVPINPERARKIAGSIPITSLKSDALLYLSYEFSKRERFKDAVESAKLIPDSYTKKKALRRISNAIAEALKSKNILEVKLSDLGLEEADVELLKPLPEGVKYEDGKFLIDANIVKTTEDFKNEVVDVTERPEEVKSPDVGELDFENISPEDLPEPLKSSFLEHMALDYLEKGEVDKAVEILKIIGKGGPLPRLLFFIGRNQDIERVIRPIDKVLLAYRILLLLPREDAIPIVEHIFEDVKKANPQKFSRILKFLSFELLEEGKKIGNKELIAKSKELFERAQRHSSSFSMNLLA